ncbi:MAG: hypothetical protein QOE23_2784 [Pseudonocardiales bacterium]|nr:hypothetical protein [Pseudonocardiales bacterium]
MTALSPATLVGVGSAMGVVSGFYYTTQRADTRELAMQPVPYDDDAARAMHGQLRTARNVLGIVLVLHLVFEVLFLVGTVDAMASIGGDQVDPQRVAVVVLFAVGLLVAWLLVSDLRSILRQYRNSNRPDPPPPELA